MSHAVWNRALFGLILFCFGHQAQADESYYEFQLTDGSTLTGQIVSETEQAYLVKVANGEVRRVVYTAVEKTTVIDQPVKENKPATIQEVSLLGGGDVQEVEAAESDPTPLRTIEGDQIIAVRQSDFAKKTLSEKYKKKARKQRQQEMKFAEDLLRRGHLKGERIAEMELRLAHLYFQEGVDTGVQDWYAKSIRNYESILEKLPSFRRADEATFYLGTVLQETGHRENGVRHFETLVASFPDSVFLPDALVHIGDFYFEVGNINEALQAYKHAVQFRTSDKYFFALYKLAWCYFKLEEYGSATEAMQRVKTLDGSSKATDRDQLQQQLKSGVQFSLQVQTDLAVFMAYQRAR